MSAFTGNDQLSTEDLATAMFALHRYYSPHSPTEAYQALTMVGFRICHYFFHRFLRFVACSHRLMDTLLTSFLLQGAIDHATVGSPAIGGGGVVRGERRFRFVRFVRFPPMYRPVSFFCFFVFLFFCSFLFVFPLCIDLLTDQVQPLSRPPSGKPWLRPLTLTPTTLWRWTNRSCWGMWPRLAL